MQNVFMKCVHDFTSMRAMLGMEFDGEERCSTGMQGVARLSPAQEGWCSVMVLQGPSGQRQKRCQDSVVHI